MSAQRVACVGVYIADVLGRAIDDLPKGQVSRIIDEIRITAAGSAGGTAVDLARLGADVLAVGAVGDDRLGAFLRATLEDEGVRTAGLVTKPGIPTSATILPISSAGERPAWHVPGANAHLAAEDVAPGALADCDAVHLGGITALPGLDGAPAARLLERARAGGAFVTADCLGIKREDARAVLEPVLPHVDVFMPNDVEALRITGATDVETAARHFRAMGAGAAIITMGAAGCLIADGAGSRRRPALPVPVVDTTGAGDAFCAGVITGHGLGWSLDDAARLGTAAAALTLQGLGSDAGVRSLADTLAFMEREEAGPACRT
jgi:sugar/nucleoside kinase (ribokinase family)